MWKYIERQGSSAWYAVDDDGDRYYIGMKYRDIYIGQHTEFKVLEQGLDTATVIGQLT